MGTMDDSAKGLCADAWRYYEACRDLVDQLALDGVPDCPTWSLEHGLELAVRVARNTVLANVLTNCPAHLARGLLDRAYSPKGMAVQLQPCDIWAEDGAVVIGGRPVRE